MGINILSGEVVNQIAAGEVLERPANLIKELIENSIDAGSTEIEIDFDLGGRFLQITDNGSGMNQEDLQKSILRHATSKIQNFSDIWSLNTYGFRGEALASIAAVSKMQMITKTKEDNKAHLLKTDFGEVQKIQSVSGMNGTKITIEDLFENVPARLKFLKSESSEATQNFKMIKAMALAHPKISFKVKQRGTLKLFYPMNQTFLERAQSVLEIQELFESVHEKENYKVRVLFSSPNLTFKTSQNILIFVQKRWVQDRAIQKAILDSYRNLLMHGEYPAVVLHLECHTQMVDVNIHPTKSQVKFQDSSSVFRVVHSTLRNALEKAPWIQNLAAMENTENISKAFENFSTSYLQNSLIDSTPSQFKQKPSLNEFQQSSTMGNLPPQLLDFKKVELLKDDSSTTDQKKLSLNENGFWTQLQVLSQLNLTYILAQSQNALFLVDQHAAHERVNFERLMSSYKSKKISIQNFLFPLVIDLSASKIELLLNISESLKSVGIEIEQSGPESLSVNSAPDFVKENALIEVIHKLAQDLEESGGSFALDKKVGDLIATLACHSSIRAGQALSKDEMAELLTNMDEFPLSSFCPHGRPVYKQILFKELDKDFGRIV